MAAAADGCPSVVGTASQADRELDMPYYQVFDARHGTRSEFVNRESFDHATRRRDRSGLL